MNSKSRKDHPSRTVLIDGSDIVIYSDDDTVEKREEIVSSLKNLSIFWNKYFVSAHLIQGLPTSTVRNGKILFYVYICVGR